MSAASFNLTWAVMLTSLSPLACCYAVVIKSINLSSGVMRVNSGIPQRNSNHNWYWTFPRCVLWERLLNMHATARHIFTSIWLARCNIIQHVAILAMFTDKYVNPRVPVAELLVIGEAYNSVGSSRAPGLSPMGLDWVEMPVVSTSK